MPDQSVRNPAIVLVEDEPDILIILHRLLLLAQAVPPGSPGADRPRCPPLI